MFRLRIKEPFGRMKLNEVSRKQVQLFHNRLLTDGLNELGLGPQGLTGNNSVMGVNIESSARHPSTIGVAVSTGCWAHRRGRIRIHADLSYDVISHQGFQL